MSSKNMDKRRKIRALEAARDKLMIQGVLTKNKLAVIRVQLKDARKS